MRRFFLVAVLSVLATNYCSAQLNRTLNWVVGNNAFANFDSSPPTVGASALQSFEGYSVISDTNGNLLFYTNGIKVWNSSHQVMANGTGLNSALSATNAALIVPKPYSDSLYYVFTVGAYGGNQGGFGGIAYSIVDMSLNGGLGAVIVKNVILHTKSTEKLCATFHENGIDYWIMSHDFGNDQFRAFLLTQNGIELPPIISKVGDVHLELPENDWGSRATRSMRFSPSGCKLGLVIGGYQTEKVQVFDFDKATGYVFNPISLQANVYSDNPYALCFSPNSSILYTSASDWIVQFNLSSNVQSTIQQSKTTVAANYLSESGSPKYNFEDLQIAPNGKIYIARHHTNYLSSFDFPNNIGALCGFVDTALVFQEGHCRYGLPNFVSNYLISDTTAAENCSKYCPTFNLLSNEIICEGDTLYLDLDLPQGDILWNNGSIGFNFPITEPGSYIATYDFNGCSTQIDTLIANLIERPLVELTDTLLCPDHSFTLALPYQDSITYLWNDGTTGNEFIVEQPGIYTLQIYNSICMFSDTMIVSLIENPIEQQSDILACLESPYTISLPIESDIFYSWSNGIINNEFTISQPGNYVVEIHYANCLYTDTFLVESACATILEMPNIFTPNNDGINDFFMPIVKSNVKELNITIFNRWGTVVYFEEGKHISWDGNHKGEKCSSGLYYYILKFIDFSDEKHSMSGNVTLID